VNVDCASPSEMSLCLNEGYTPDKIIYANTMKSVNDIDIAPKLGVNLTTVDSIEGVEQIASVNWSPDILVRLAVDDSEAKSPFSIKFGAVQDEWKKIVAAIDYYKLNLKGVSFHVGSGSASPAAFVKAINTCKEFHAKTNQSISTVDIGGGFLHDEQSFSKIATAIRTEMGSWRHPQNWIAEPGRFFSNPIQTLYVPIVFCKENDESYRYILDESVYGQFNNILFDHCKPQWVVLDSNLKPLARSETNKSAFFFGKTCDSMDFIAFQSTSPKYKIGDVFAFPNMGAYTSATATTFNGFQLPNKIYTDDLLPEYTIVDNTKIVHPISVKSDIDLSISRSKIN
jgi:ornithine decarboxylase